MEWRRIGVEREGAGNSGERGRKSMVAISLSTLAEWRVMSTSIENGLSQVSNVGDADADEDELIVS